MSRLRIHTFTISLDGYGAGPNQDLDNPLGRGGHALHEWMTNTRTFQQMVGHDQGSTGVDDDFVARGLENVGAWILGRNMFGPIRGDWPDDRWNGWWGDIPPYHTDVFVLTHHARTPIVMKGGTTFHFVTDGIHAALQRATPAAKGKDIPGLIDEMHVAISPVMLGQGEHLLHGIDTLALGYDCTQHVTTRHATHFVLTKRR